jgi:hypothetical protein
MEEDSYDYNAVYATMHVDVQTLWTDCSTG